MQRIILLFYQYGTGFAAYSSNELNGGELNMLEFLNQLDGDILLFIQEYIRNPVLTPFFQWVTELGDKGMVWIIISVCLLCFKKTRMTGIVSLISLIVCFYINNRILKMLVARPRPFEMLSDLQVLIPKPRDYSFPSGHTASSFAAAGAVYFCGSRKWRIPALILAALIGFSRLYLGVHYSSDVLGGVLVGLGVSWVVCRLLFPLQCHSPKSHIVN